MKRVTNTLCFIALISLNIACVKNSDAPCRNTIVADSVGIATTFTYGYTDTLRFTSTLNDTVILPSTIFSVHKLFVRGNTPNHPNCPNDYISYDIENAEFTNSPKGLSLQYKVEAVDNICSLKVNTEWLTFKAQSLGKRDSTFIDSINLNGRMFYGVNTFVSNSGKKYYVHQSLGLLQLDSNYTLIP
jgi:hypothetical protein